MLRFFADENFNGDIVRGLRLRDPGFEIVRVQDTEVVGAEDPVLLAWAARQNRILLTHDRATMPDFAYQRVARGEGMLGVFVVSDRMLVGQAIEELLLVAGASQSDEWAGRVFYLPL